MSQVTSLTDALRRRMSLIAQAMSERVSHPGAWEGYRADEGLDGRYTHDPSLGYAPTLDYHRPSNPEATISLGFVEMVSIQEELPGDVTVIREGIEESHEWDVEFKHPIEYEETLSHTFEKTVSEQEATAKAWEVSAKASIGVNYAGITGSLEVAGKYGETLNRQVSDSETERDTISRTLRFKGPASFRLRAERSRNRESRVMRARADWDGKIYFNTSETQWEFTTFRTQFLPIIRRTAPDDVYGYQEFVDAPMTDDEIAAIEAPPEGVIEWVAEYDAILTQSLREV